jgi:hypothetical protein
MTKIPSEMFEVALSLLNNKKGFLTKNWYLIFIQGKIQDLLLLKRTVAATVTWGKKTQNTGSAFP